jgi:hypothetical protein
VPDHELERVEHRVERAVPVAQYVVAAEPENVAGSASVSDLHFGERIDNDPSVLLVLIEHYVIAGVRLVHEVPKISADQQLIVGKELPYRPLDALEAFTVLPFEVNSAKGYGDSHPARVSILNDESYSARRRLRYRDEEACGGAVVDGFNLLS